MIAHRPPDFALTLALLAPILAFGLAVAIAHRPRPRPPYRLTEGDLRRRFGLTWEMGAAFRAN